MSTTQQDIESRLSYAYLHAVVSHAGFVCRPATPDEDKEGIDAAVTAYGSFPGTWRTQVTINVQLKATVKTPTDDGSYLSYSVQGIRRYDKLREDHREPVRILVILFLPQANADWLNCSENELILKKCAYWVSLRNASASDNQTAQTVKIPKNQLFSQDNLNTLINRLALGTDIPRYLEP
jgi:hypothetical protein